MTATADFTNTYDGPLEPVRMVDGGRMIVRGVQRFAGASLVLAAAGLWFAPGATWESDVMLFKMILSMAALLAGLGLMQSSATPNTPEVEIDTIRREVRLVRFARQSGTEILQQYAFSDLSFAEANGNHVRLWGQDKVLLAEVTLTDRKALNSLIAGLQDAGKLA